MRRWGTALVSAVTVSAVTLGLGALSPVPAQAGAQSAQSAVSAASAAVVPVAARKKPKFPRNYNPPAGLRFNEPYGRGGTSKVKIRRHVLKSIDSTRRGDVIQMAAWNVRGNSWAQALIRAHRRGVAVQVIIDTINWAPDHPNPEVAAIARVLKGPEKKRAVQSWLKQCKGSCRGARGIPHSKFFLFSKVASTPYVTMFGSNNATDVAAKDQWNDLFTYTNNKTVYSSFQRIFTEMSRDRSVGGAGFQRLSLGGKDKIEFYPYKGAAASAAGDPDMARLNAIRCTGATGGAGKNGRTTIRIVQTAIHGDRGLVLARKLVQLRKAGCDIRVVYAIMGGKVHKMLTRARVPKLQLAYDRDRNGVYDIYVHMKSMAISGVYGRRTDARVVVNGSANWSRLPLNSDEVVGEYHNVGLTNAYTRWTNWLFNHRPKSWGPVNLAPVGAPSGVDRRIEPVDPYALMREEGVLPAKRS